MNSYADKNMTELGVLLDRVFAAAEKGKQMVLSADEVERLSKFLVELTAQNGELARRLHIAEQFMPKAELEAGPEGPWSPLQ